MYLKEFVYVPSQSANLNFNSTLKSNVITHNPVTKADISVHNNTGDVQGVSVQHYWDVQVNSIGGSDGPFTWMALKKPVTSGIIIDSVNILSGNTIGSSLPVAGTYNVNSW